MRFHAVFSELRLEHETVGHESFPSNYLISTFLPKGDNDAWVFILLIPAGISMDPFFAGSHDLTRNILKSFFTF